MTGLDLDQQALPSPMGQVFRPDAGQRTTALRSIISSPMFSMVT